MHPPAPTTQRPVQAALAMHNPLMAPPATTAPPFVPPTPESPQTPQLALASDPLAKTMPSNGTSSPAPSGGVPVKSPEQSWATVGSNGKVEKNYSIAPAPKKQRPFIVLNKDDERLDIPINRSRANFDGLEQRIRRTGKVCNSYHLTGVCHNMYCDYDHQPRLSEGEQIALRTKARQKSCPAMLSCRDPTCINGHQCTWGANCTYGDDCFFAETHHMDRTPVKKVELDDTEI